MVWKQPFLLRLPRQIQTAMRLNSKLGKGVGVLLFTIYAISNLNGQELPEVMEEPRDSIQWNDWSFRISPYFWYIGLQGEIYKPPQPNGLVEPPPPRFEIDVGFRDIRNSIKFALMLASQYRGDRVVAQFNFSSLILESEAITPLNVLLQNNVLRLTYFGGDIEAGYRVIRNPKFEVDALAGLKFVYFGVDVSSDIAGAVPVEGARSKGWIDPVVGVNLRYNPHRKVGFLGYGDISIPAVTTYFTGQFFGVVQYHWTPTFYISLGYRSYFVDIPKGEAIFNGALKGWITRIGFQF